jgi:hypothetical protein
MSGKMVIPEGRYLLWSETPNPSKWRLEGEFAELVGLIQASAVLPGKWMMTQRVMVDNVELDDRALAGPAVSLETWDTVASGVCTKTVSRSIWHAVQEAFHGRPNRYSDQAVPLGLMLQLAKSRERMRQPYFGQKKFAYLRSIVSRIALRLSEDDIPASEIRLSSQLEDKLSGLGVNDVSRLISELSFPGRVSSRLSKRDLKEIDRGLVSKGLGVE